MGRISSCAGTGVICCYREVVLWMQSGHAQKVAARRYVDRGRTKRSNGRDRRWNKGAIAGGEEQSKEEVGKPPCLIWLYSRPVAFNFAIAETTKLTVKLKQKQTLCSI